MVKKLLSSIFVVSLFLSACAPAEESTAPQAEIQAPAVVENTAEPVVEEQAPPTQEPAQELIKMKIGMRPYLSFAPIYIAIEEGYFAEEGIDLEMVDIANGAEGMVGLATGDLDISAGLIDTGSITLIGQTPGVKIVADKGYVPSVDECVYAGFYVRNDAPDYQPGMDLSFMDGKNTVSWGNSVAEYALDLALRPSGASVMDYGFENLPAPTRVEALLGGQYSVVGLGEPWIARGMKSDQMKLFVSMNQILPGSQTGAVWYGARLTEEDPELGIRWMRAYKRGVEQYNEGFTERNIEIFVKYSQADPVELPTLCMQAIHNDLSVNTDFLKDFQEWGLSVGLMDEVFPIERIFDGSFIEAVN